MSQITMPNISLPNSGTDNWGTLYNQAITAIRDALHGITYVSSVADIQSALTTAQSAISDLQTAVNGCALDDHTHTEFASLLAYCDSLAATKAEDNHSHTVADFTDLATLFMNITNKAITKGISGLGTDSPSVILDLAIADAVLVMWEVTLTWGTSQFGQLIVSPANKITIPKLPADSSLWSNNKCNLSLSIKAKNPFGGSASATVTETVEVTKYNYITVAALASALASDTAFVNKVATDVANSAVAELWAIQNS